MTNCVFCALIAEAAALWVAKRADAVAFAPLPQDAIAAGHTLVVPRRHCDGVLTAEDPTPGAAWRTFTGTSYRGTKATVMNACLGLVVGPAPGGG